MNEEMRRILAEWAEELSKHLARPAVEIRARGLSVFDFNSADGLELQFPDGSTAHFKYAFFVVSDLKRVAIFTEHCGYWVIPSHGLIIFRDGLVVFRGEEA